MAKKQPIKSPPVPLSLSAAAVTPASLGRRNYQRKLLAHFAPALLIKCLKSLEQALDDHDDNAARRQVLEIYGLIEGKKDGVNVFVNQQTMSATVSRAPADDGAMASFEDIARIVDGERRRKLLAPAGVIDAQFEPTPEE